MNSTSKRPNILLITTDHQRFDTLGINGNPVLETPILDSLAAGGMNFTRAYSPCPICIPARRTILSGLHPDTHGMHSNVEGEEFNPPRTLPGVLRDAGYQTEMIGKMHMFPQGKCFGFEHIVLSETPNFRPTSRFQKRNDYVDYLRSQGIQEHPCINGITSNSRVARPSWLPEEHHHNTWLVKEAARFLCEKRDPSRPWFLHLSFSAPHPPLTPPAVYFDKYEKKGVDSPVLGEWVPHEPPRRGVRVDSQTGPFFEDEMRRARIGFYGLINHIDDCLSYLFDRYFEYGSGRGRDPVYVLFTSDHGEMLGDHHLFRKSLAYEGSSHLPFFISGFNVPLKAKTVNDLVSLEDIMPTLLDLAGVEIPEGLDGRSLAGYVRGDKPVAAREILAGGCHGPSNWYLIEGTYKYIWFSATNEEQLFDLEHDPHETHDLSAESAEVLRRMRERMAEYAATRDDLAYDPQQLQPCANRPPRAFTWNC
ncbi:MAG: sulfatase [Lentisphaerae bacterium]|nr:MAG: sulfatase [Lentisphaerota bacterium]